MSRKSIINKDFKNVINYLIFCSYYEPANYYNDEERKKELKDFIAYNRTIILKNNLKAFEGFEYKDDNVNTFYYYRSKKIKRLKERNRKLLVEKFVDSKFNEQTFLKNICYFFGRMQKNKYGIKLVIKRNIIKYFNFKFDNIEEDLKQIINEVPPEYFKSEFGNKNRSEYILKNKERLMEIANKIKLDDNFITFFNSAVEYLDNLVDQVIELEKVEDNLSSLEVLEF